MRNYSLTGNAAFSDVNIDNLPGQIKMAYMEIILLEPLITSDMKNTTHHLGTDLDGLEHSIKTASSVSNKLYRQQNTILESGGEWNENVENKSFHEFKDIIRYTEICDHDDIIKTTEETIKNLEEKGYILSQIKNYYANPYPGTGYMGIHLNFITPFGQEIELQVHSPESFDVKQRGHEIYEKIRVCVSENNDALIKYKMMARDIFQSIEKPQNYTELKAMTMPIEDKIKLINERKSATKILIESTNFNKSRLYVFSVCHNDIDVLSGYACRFSDGSMRICRHFDDDDKEHVYNMDEKGKIILQTQLQYKTKSLHDLERMIVDLENTYKTFYKKELLNKEMEDFNIQSSQIPMEIPNRFKKISAIEVYR